ncbi:MAG: hypothetical protein P8L21_06120 [Polaribacter sp.]|nr:hypothetical protein [Polaribacter sp.]
MNKKIYFKHKNRLFLAAILHKIRNYYLRMKEYDIDTKVISIFTGNPATIVRENIKMNDQSHWSNWNLYDNFYKSL